jgi:hypothetical protein
MEKIAEINNRNISFEEYNTSKNWIAEFPTENWCLIIVAEEENRNYFDEIIRKAIDRNVAYIFSVGKQHDLIHDMVDEEIVFRDVDIEDYYLPKHMIMTAGEEDFEDGIWQGIYTTHQNETDIEEVIILDVTKRALEKTKELVRKFELGHLPED